MKTHYSFVTLIITSVLLIVSTTALATAQTPVAEGIHIVSTAPNKIVVELAVNDFDVETITTADQTYQRLLIDKMVQTMEAGAPQVPMRGSWVGVPSTKDLSIQILETEKETLTDYVLHPAPAVEIEGTGDQQTLVETFRLDKKRYRTNQLYPNKLVNLGDTGYIRSQAVAQLQFYPVQYNPVSQEVELYHRIVVEISWASNNSANDQQDSRTYENILKNTLLNYDTLNRSVVSPKMTRKGIARQANDGVLLKIAVEEDGIYEISYDDLLNAGVDFDQISQPTVSLSHLGQEVPIQTMLSGTNSFTQGDKIWFYGLAIDTIYTTENIYYLTLGSTDGPRMSTVSAPPNNNATLADKFLTNLHREEDTVYWQTMPDPVEGEDHWFWGDRLGNGSDKTREYSATINNFSSATDDVMLQVALKGGTTGAHHTKIYWNNTEVDSQLWSGTTTFTHRITTGITLQAGENILKVETPVDTGASVDQIYVNSFDIQYQAVYQAEDDRYHFGVPSTGEFLFEVTNFSTNTVNLFDVTDPNNVMHLTDIELQADNNNFTLRFSQNSNDNTHFLAVTSANYKTPTHITPITNLADLRSTANGADHIIITYHDFYSSAIQLRDMHRANNLRAEIVDIEDIYREFSAGISTPQAIQDFLKYTYGNWQQPAPSYVVLLGDGTTDHRGLLGTPSARSAPNYIPVQLVEMQEGDTKGQAPSDNWFVQLVGDDVLPDMMIGRLPAKDATEAANMVDKIINYQTDSTWQKNVLLIADDGNDTKPNDPSFETLSEEIANELPYDYTTNKVYVREVVEQNGNPTNEVTNSINNGNLFVNYAGHGELRFWGRWGPSSESLKIFNLTNVKELENDNKWPVVTVGNCLSGYFAHHHWNEVSVAEEFLLNQNTGASAVWAPTWLDYPSAHRPFLTDFYQRVFQQDEYIIGQATNAAKLNIYAQNPLWASLVKSFVLFGDPAMSLDVAPNAPYLIETFPASGETDLPVGVGLEAFFNKPVVSSTVIFDVDDGGFDITFDPIWNDDFTAVNYFTDEVFPYNHQVVLTITGQDKLGNQILLSADQANLPVPNPWHFTTQTLAELQTVVITGPTVGYVDNPLSDNGYDFIPIINPDTATKPITYTWQATEQETIQFTRFATGNVQFKWDRPGTKIVTVTAQNVGGSASDSHQFVVQGQTEAVDPTMETRLTYNENNTMIAEVVVPIGAVDKALDLEYAPLLQPITPITSPNIFAGRAFFLSAVENSTVLDEYTFQQPISLTLYYEDGNFDESSLVIKYADTSGTWQDIAQSCSEPNDYVRDPDINKISILICHLSEFALVQEAVLQRYLPIVIK